MNPKPGWQTSEYWPVVALVAAAVASALGLIQASENEAFRKDVTELLIIGATFAATAFGFFRTWLKRK